MSTQPKAVTLNVIERTRGALSPLNLHWAGVALLGLINLYLLIHMGFAYQAASSQNAEALAQQQIQLKTAEIAARPLQGLDTKLKTASVTADQFSLERLPATISEVAGELGNLSKKSNVRYTRAQYAYTPVEGDAAGQLTQVSIDAGLSGDYRGLMLFINGLERDQTFFLINGVTLTGQQTGLVSLRIRIVTYLRGLTTDEEIARVQIAPPDEKSTDDPADPAVTSASAGGAR